MDLTIVTMGGARSADAQAPPGKDRKTTAATGPSAASALALTRMNEDYVHQGIVDVLVTSCINEYDPTRLAAVSDTDAYPTTANVPGVEALYDLPPSSGASPNPVGGAGGGKGADVSAQITALQSQVSVLTSKVNDLLTAKAQGRGEVQRDQGEERRWR